VVRILGKVTLGAPKPFEQISMAPRMGWIWCWAAVDPSAHVEGQHLQELKVRGFGEPEAPGLRA
jgi:hypothetical protein